MAYLQWIFKANVILWSHSVWDISRLVYCMTAPSYLHSNALWLYCTQCIAMKVNPHKLILWASHVPLDISCPSPLQQVALVEKFLPRVADIHQLIEDCQTVSWVSHCLETTIWVILYVLYMVWRVTVEMSSTQEWCYRGSLLCRNSWISLSKSHSIY